MAQVLACFTGSEDKVKRIERRENKLLGEMNVLERRIHQQNYLAGRAYYEQNDLFAARKCWNTNKVLRARYTRVDAKLVKLQNKRTRLGMSPSASVNRPPPIIVVDARTHNVFHNALEDNKGIVSMAKVANNLANVRATGQQVGVELTPLMAQNVRGQNVDLKTDKPMYGPGGTGAGAAGRFLGGSGMQVDAFEDDEDLFASFDMMDIEEEASGINEPTEKMIAN